MFLFTTTTVINNTNWGKEKDARWSFLEADDEKKIPASINIKGVGIFKAPNITKAFKSEGHEGKIGKFSFTMPSDAQKGDLLRLSFTIALSLIDHDPLYANDYSYKGKKFFVDFPYMDNAAETAANLEKIVNKAQLNIYSRKLWDLKATGSTVEVEGMEWSQRFKDIKVEKLNDNSVYYRDFYEELDVDADITDGKDDFLTSDWLTRNLRLPTYARIHYKAPNEHENPIPESLYNQYTIHYCAKRGQLGLNAVGLEVTSTTTHVFFVLLDIAPKFEAELEKVLANSDVELEEVLIP